MMICIPSLMAVKHGDNVLSSTRPFTTSSLLQAASPLAPGDKGPKPNAHRSKVQQVGVEDQEGGPPTTIRMTGTGFFVASAGGGNNHGNKGRDKNGPLPDNYSRGGGYRDTFGGNCSGSGSTTNAAPAPGPAPSPPKTDKDNNPTKKWSFGGLFKRKVKAPQNATTTTTTSNTFLNINSLKSPPAPYSAPNTPASKEQQQKHRRQLQQQQPPQHHRSSYSGTNGNAYVSTPTSTRAPNRHAHAHAHPQLNGGHLAAPSESDVTSDSDATQTLPQDPAAAPPAPQQHPSFKDNFLVRRLSRRKEKAKKKVGVVGRSPSPTNNVNSVWEITKKVPQCVNNYSSSGSLSLSQEGSLKGSRREAVKARAVARRESFLQDSSSEEEQEEDAGRGSQPSLQAAKKQRGQVVVLRPQIDYIRGSPSPARLHAPQQQSPNRNLIVPRGASSSASPRWEARVVYTQEDHDEVPFVVRLPGRAAAAAAAAAPAATATATATSTCSEQIITAGLRVPMQNGREITEEVHYANLPGYRGTHGHSQSPVAYTNRNSPAQAPPPPPPPRGRALPRQNFYRPVSCSYLDAYQGRGAGAGGNINMAQLQRSYSPAPHHNHNHNNTPYPSQQENGNYLVEDGGGWGRGGGGFYVVGGPYQHQPLMRSPSEPPEMGGIGRRAVATPTPYNNAPCPQPHPQLWPSKLGHPVRRWNSHGDHDQELQQQQQPPQIQSPVHMRASEFWRKKEAESGVAQPQSQSQRLQVNRIRSADSSPLPGHRRRGQNSSPLAAAPQAAAAAAYQASNESISSLSSFSAEAAKFRSLIPQREERERHEKESIQPPTPLTPSSLVDLNNGKTPGRNLEDALNELEDMYKSLRLSDEDLLERAERRDLPTPHQLLKNGNGNGPTYTYGRRGSVESLPTTGTNSTGSGSGSGGSSGGTTATATAHEPGRTRAPPLRRSARPDTIGDDMARRRRAVGAAAAEIKPLDPRHVVAKTGSYMGLSPAFSPPCSPTPPHFSYPGEEPDLTLDDVSFRTYRAANAIRIIDPQPKFGIPLGPISSAPSSDYLHSKKSGRLRPLFKSTKNPDLVNDDIAFRSLRKDLGEGGPGLGKDWTPRLFSPGRERDMVFSYNEAAEDAEEGRRLRAIRSLSANITNYNRAVRGLPFDAEKSNSFSDLEEGGKGRVKRGSAHWRPGSGRSWREMQLQLQLEGGDGSFFANKCELPEELVDWERKSPAKTVQLTPDLYDPGRSRRPWTDIILEGFLQDEKDKEKGGEEGGSGGGGGAEDEDEVFMDARDKSKSTSPEQTQVQVQQQLGRRGSWIESKTSSYLLPPQNEEERRKSWSELPKRNDLNFNPLPSPKRIKQVHLAPLGRGLGLGLGLVAPGQQQEPEQKMNEQELVALMDLLIKEANCRKSQPTPQPPKRGGGEETQTQTQTPGYPYMLRYKMMEEEGEAHPEIVSRNMSQANPSTLQVSPMETGGSTAPGERSIEELIDSINESLPELEASIGNGNGAVGVGGSSSRSGGSISSTGSGSGSSGSGRSPPPSVPSPRPASPNTTTILLQDSPIPEKRRGSLNNNNPDGESPLPPISRRSSTSTTGSGSSLEPTTTSSTSLKKKGEDAAVGLGVSSTIFSDWSGILLIACYCLAFLHTFATLDPLPIIGILLAVFVFFAHLF